MRACACLALLIALGLGTVACERDGAETVATPPSTTNGPVTPAINLWERTRQCADHAERVVAELRRSSDRNPREPSIFQWSNHYNRREERCYVEVNFFDPTAKDKRGVAAIFYRELYDAVEHSRMAGNTSSRLSDPIAQDIYCFLPDPDGDRNAPRGTDCDATYKFIADKMRD